MPVGGMMDCQADEWRPTYYNENSPVLANEKHEGQGSPVCVGRREKRVGSKRQLATFSQLGNICRNSTPI